MEKEQDINGLWDRTRFFSSIWGSTSKDFQDSSFFFISAWLQCSFGLIFLVWILIPVSWVSFFKVLYSFSVLHCWKILVCGPLVHLRNIYSILIFYKRSSVCYLKKRKKNDVHIREEFPFKWSAFKVDRFVHFEGRAFVVFPCESALTWALIEINNLHNLPCVLLFL